MKTEQELQSLTIELNGKVRALLGDDAGFGFSLSMNTGKLKNRIRIDAAVCTPESLRALADLIEQYS